MCEVEKEMKGSPEQLRMLYHWAGIYSAGTTINSVTFGGKQLISSLQSLTSQSANQMLTKSRCTLPDAGILEKSPQNKTEKLAG